VRERVTVREERNQEREGGEILRSERLRGENREVRLRGEAVLLRIKGMSCEAAPLR
jgi:hypothetical protein